jgi:outer membrane lipoprotein-sorting protein
MNFKTKITILLIVIFLNGCAIKGVNTLAEIKEPKKILVFSSMGDDYELMHIGTTIFTNKYKTIDVSDWQIDTTIEEKVSEFNLDDRFQLVSQDLSSIKQGMNKLSNRTWSENIDFNGYEDKIFSYALKDKFDMILFVKSYETEDPVFFTGLYVDGYGIYKRSLFGSKNAKYYAISSVSLYDVETRKRVAGTMRTMTDFTIKYNDIKGVESIDYSSITEDKLIMFDLLLEGIRLQLIDLGMIN